MENVKMRIKNCAMVRSKSHCMNTILQNQLKSKPNSMQIRFFVNYADIYVNIIMSTHVTNIELICTILYYISRCSVLRHGIILNIVFARHPAFFMPQVKIIYLWQIFVHFNDRHEFYTFVSNPFYAL